MQTIITRAMGLWTLLVRALDALQPAAALAARIYLGHAFFASGLTKLRDGDATLALFTDEYQVPLLPPGLAAPLGTTGELVLPVLLVFGFGGRFAALGLFVLNLVAANSLPDIGEGALLQHIFWGSLAAGLAIYGPGAWSVERFVWPRLRAVTS